MTDKVSTWADGYGVWYAAVPMSSLDDQLNNPRGARQKEANAARKAIRAALTEREGPNFDPRTVHVTRHGYSSIPGRVIYREVTR